MVQQITFIGEKLLPWMKTSAPRPLVLMLIENKQIKFIITIQVAKHYAIVVLWSQLQLKFYFHQHVNILQSEFDLISISSS